MLETRRDPPVRLELDDVHVLGDPVGVTANCLAVSDPGRLRDQPAVLGDQAMTAEDQVSRRFRRPGASIRVGGDAPARLSHHQLGPILALANGFIAGRQVEQDRRAGPRLHRAGGKRHPEVLADLDPHHDGNTLLSLTREQQVDSEGHSTAREFDLGRLGAVGGPEPAALVKLLVIRDVPLGNDPQDLPVRQRHSAIEKAIAHRHWQPGDDKLPSPGRGLGDPANRPKAPLQQGSLAKQIGTRVARDAKLGKQNDVAVSDLVQNPDNFRGVGLGIGDRGQDRSTGHADETKSVHATNPTAQPPVTGLGTNRPVPTTRISAGSPKTARLTGWVIRE